MIIYSITLTLLMCMVCTAIDSNEKPHEDGPEAANKFSMKLFTEYATKTKDSNMVMSPLSAWMTLAMASYGASGRTLEEMKKSLFLPENYRNLEFFKPTSELSKMENAEGKIHLDIKNKMYVSQGFKVKDQFIAMVSSLSGSEMSMFDRLKPFEAADGINKWVSDATHEKIKELINQDDITEDIRVILLNAIYFKGNWKVKFDPTDTKMMQFHTALDGIKDVTTMSIEHELFRGYLEDFKASFIRLPYENEDAHMTIIVPDRSSSIEDLLKNLGSLNASHFEKSGFYQHVHLYLPKFKINSHVDLEESLKQLGMQDMFANTANFSDMSDEPLHVSKIKQKTMIEVNEEGSEAAAATVEMTAIRSDKSFKIDRPFLFLVTVKNVTILMGRLGHPHY